MPDPGSNAIRLLAGAALLSAAAGCSLGNIPVDACSSDEECADAFGAGSTCNDGYCSSIPECQTGHDCRRTLGGGACVNGTCITTLPSDPSGACTTYEPEDLAGTSLIGGGAPVLIGGMFFLNDSFGPPIRDAARLAVRQINEFGAMQDGRPLALVVCDNFGDKAAAYTEARDEFVVGAVDYLARTLGVAFAVGPLRSADAAPAVAHLVDQRLPTMLITPSATSAVLSGPIDRIPGEEIGLFWRTAPSDEFQARVLASSVVGTYPEIATVNTVVIPYLEDEYGIGLQQIFQSEYAGASVPQPFPETAAAADIANAASGAPSDAVLFIDVEVDRARAFVEEMAGRPALSSRTLLLTDGSRNAELFTGASAAALTFLFNNTVGTAPAPAQTPLFNTFKAELATSFMWDADAVVFTEHAYDATYAGAAAVVFAGRNGSDYDGRQVALGMPQLVNGAPVDVGAIGWANIKSGVVAGINLNGVSGDLDWDPNGEVKAPIEVWRPQDACTGPGSPPCLVTVQTIPVSAL